MISVKTIQKLSVYLIFSWQSVKSLQRLLIFSTEENLGPEGQKLQRCHKLNLFIASFYNEILTIASFQNFQDLYLQVLLNFFF